MPLTKRAPTPDPLPMNASLFQTHWNNEAFIGKSGDRAGRMGGVLVVLRFEVGVVDQDGFLAEARTALAVLAERPGWRASRIGRATDDPTTWIVSTEWDGVGDYRRALSNHDVRMRAVPLLSRALDEPTAFEVLDAAGLGAEGLAGPSARAADADVTGPGGQRLA